MKEPTPLREYWAHKQRELRKKKKSKEGISEAQKRRNENRDAELKEKERVDSFLDMKHRKGWSV